MTIGEVFNEQGLLVFKPDSTWIESRESLHSRTNDVVLLLPEHVSQGQKTILEQWARLGRISVILYNRHHVAIQVALCQEHGKGNDNASEGVTHSEGDTDSESELTPSEDTDGGD